MERMAGAEAALAGPTEVAADGVLHAMTDSAMAVAVAVTPSVMPAVMAIAVAVTPSEPDSVVLAVSFVAVMQRLPVLGMPAIYVSLGPLPAISAALMIIVVVPSRRSGERKGHQQPRDGDGCKETPFPDTGASGPRPRTLFGSSAYACHPRPSFGSLWIRRAGSPRYSRLPH